MLTADALRVRICEMALLPQEDDNGRDLRLVRRALARDADALGELAERMRVIPRVLAAKNRRMQTCFTADDLADIAQEAFSTLWAKIESYRGDASLETFATRFALLTFMNAWRRMRRAHLSMNEEPAGAATPGETASRREWLHEALARLKPGTARVLKLREFHRLSFDEIAIEVGEPLGTVKNRYYRGLERMRSMLAGRREEMQ